MTGTLRTPVVLASGEALWENQTRVSLDGAYRLQYQGDGNLVVVRLADDSCAWSSQTNGTSVGAAVMQGDGNLVIYNGDWTGIWSTGTWGHDGARLEIANDTMAVVAPDNTILWSVSLAAAPAASAVPGTSAGAAPGAAGILVLLVALIGLVTKGARRRWFSPEPRAVRRVQRRLPATALLLTALLLVPATSLAQIPTQVIEYYYTDAIGSVRAVTNQVNGAWQVIARHDYMPFGEEIAPPSPPQDKRLFTGKERDCEIGLDYFEARYLQATAGRFTTVDPVHANALRLASPQRLNLYAYAKNNPLAFIDPDGRDIIYAGNLKNVQTVKDSVQAILADPRTAGNLSGYVGSNNPNLIIQSGDLSAGDTRTVNPDGSVTTTTVMGNTAPDIQTTSSSSTDMNGVTTTTGPETTLKGATITIDNRTGRGDIPGIMVHESVHAGEARANPAKFAKDAAAEKSNPNHDARPQEQRANAAQNAYAKAIQAAVKQIERDRKKENQ